MCPLGHPSTRHRMGLQGRHSPPPQRSELQSCLHSLLLAAHTHLPRPSVWPVPRRLAPWPSGQPCGRAVLQLQNPRTCHLCMTCSIQEMISASNDMIRCMEKSGTESRQASKQAGRQAGGKRLAAPTQQGRQARPCRAVQRSMFHCSKLAILLCNNTYRPAVGDARQIPCLLQPVSMKQASFQQLPCRSPLAVVKAMMSHSPNVYPVNLGVGAFTR